MGRQACSRIGYAGLATHRNASLSLEGLDIATSDGVQNDGHARYGTLQVMVNSLEERLRELGIPVDPFVSRAHKVVNQAASRGSVALDGKTLIFRVDDGRCEERWKRALGRKCGLAYTNEPCIEPSGGGTLSQRIREVVLSLRQHLVSSWVSHMDLSKSSSCGSHWNAILNMLVVER